MDDGVLPPAKLRAMEVSANELFASYMQNYYENGASSVYFWELDDTSFAACVLFKKDVEQKKKGLEAGGCARRAPHASASRAPARAPTARLTCAAGRAPGAALFVQGMRSTSSRCGRAAGGPRTSSRRR